jgi:hypothetical protein
MNTFPDLRQHGTWWVSWAALFVFLLVPGPQKGVFSGVPLSGKATAVFLMFAGVAIATSLVQRTRSPRRIWPIVLLIAVGGKILLSAFLVTAGWRGTYETAQIRGDKRGEALRVMRFTTPSGQRPYRIEGEINVRNRTMLGADFINDRPRSPYYENILRDVAQPMRITWRGFAWAGSAQTAPVQLTAKGIVTLRVNDRELYRGQNPQRRPIALPLRSGTNHIEVLYEKAAGIEPTIVLSGVPAVTAEPADDRSRAWSGTATLAINLLGALAMLAFAIALIESYGTLRETLPQLDAGKIATLCFVGAFLVIGVVRSVPQRHSTIQLRIGDDFLNYEGMSREILRGNVMVTRGAPLGQGEPYYHYPLYPFGLAAAHYLFGDDFANVILFNCICLAMLGPVIRGFLKRDLSSVAIAVAIAASFLFIRRYALPYTVTAFSDNPFLILMLASLLVSVRALDSGGTRLFFVTGISIAIAAATRPSAFIYLPFLVLVILMMTTLGGFMARTKAILATIAGFVVAVSPFTIRNKIVSGRWVMLVGGYMSITSFLLPPEAKRHVGLLVNGKMPTMVQTLHQVLQLVMQEPAAILWTACRKVLFTFGWTTFGPGTPSLPFLGIYPFLFLAALLLRRIPKTIALVLGAFLLSHLASMVLAAPWTYGYKSILPFHLACIVGAAFLLKPLAWPFRKPEAAAEAAGTSAAVAPEA